MTTTTIVYHVYQVFIVHLGQLLVQIVLVDGNKIQKKHHLLQMYV